MANKRDKEEDLPLDDYGIQNDKIIDIVEYIINNIHDVITIEPCKMSLDDMHKMSITIETCWSLVQEILSLEEHLRKKMDDWEEGGFYQDDSDRV